MAILSKRCLRYIQETILNFVEKSELVTNQGVDIDVYEESLKKVKKMCKKLPDNPEKYLDEDYLTPEIVEKLEEEALEWEEHQSA